MGKIIGEGITFDDVLLQPGYSEVIPNQVDLTTNLTKKIKLNIMGRCQINIIQPIEMAIFFLPQWYLRDGVFRCLT
jgi:hypothetical protein